MAWTLIGNIAGPQGADGADGDDGAPGADGRDVQLQSSGGYIQWRRVGDSSWTNLVALTAITGPAGANGSNGAAGADGTNGRQVEIQKTATYIQWRYVGDTAWTNLVALSAITGPAGSDATVTDSAVASQVTSGTTTKAALNAAYAVRWEPSTAYTAGQRVVNPALQIVTAKTNHTSGSSYSSADWSYPSGMHRFESSTTGDHPLTVWADKGDGNGMLERFTVENTSGGGACDVNFRNVDINFGSTSDISDAHVKFYNKSGTTVDTLRVFKAGSTTVLTSKITNEGRFVSYAPGVATTSFVVQTWGAANALFTIGADGKFSWGAGGASALDTYLYRDSSGALKTDGSISAASLLVGTAPVVTTVAGKTGPTVTLAASDIGAVPTTRTVAGLDLSADRTAGALKTALALAKGDVGLGSVDNTSDVNKPVSTAQQAALDLKQNAATAISYGWKSGNYYIPAGVVSNSTRVLTNGQAWAAPIIVPRSVTIDRLGCEVTVAGDASATIRLGLYGSNADGTPGTLLVDGGAQPANAVGGVTVTISQALSPGLYFVVMVGQGATTTPTVRAFVGSSVAVGSTALTTLTSGNAGGWNTLAGSVTGTLPGTLTINGVATSVPTPGVRVA